MNAPEHPLEKQLDYPLGQQLPAPGERLDVAPGIGWLRMPLPFALDHINLWLLRDRFEGRDGWTLIDAGASTGKTRAAWEQVFDQRLDGLPIVRVLCTHAHPDHLGLADWVASRFAAPLWMTQGEYMTGRAWSTPGARQTELSLAHFRRHGVTDEAVLTAIANHRDRPYTTLVPSIPPTFRRIGDQEMLHIGPADPGDADSQWRVIFGYGHSPEHAALYNPARGILVSGDMVLPRISSNVSVWEMEPESNPVQWYIDSLQRYRLCDAGTLVLPAHGKPFRNLHRRVEQLVEHHEDRLAAVLHACAQSPHHAAQTVPVMFERQFDPQQTIFAIGEALGHLHALWYRGLVRRTTGDDGVVRFAAVAGALDRSPARLPTSARSHDDAPGPT